MACPNRNRKRPRTVAFRLTDEEFMRLDQRVKITGEVKGDYLRAMALTGEINIGVGKYQSDKLALELKKLTNGLDKVIEKNYEKDIYGIVTEIKLLFEELHKLVTEGGNDMTV